MLKKMFALFATRYDPSDYTRFLQRLREGATDTAIPHGADLSPTLERTPDRAWFFGVGGDSALQHLQK